ncbi:hypothetical protein DH2020_013915 [Rehmannia glutinosa]|uniref:Uncharacterized protein n=1 Tax=Rehmannia glutinosa TaxID=99300 RepID=A0ABR0WVN1_REHGL
MERRVEVTQPQFRSGISGPKHGEMGFGFDEIHGPISGPPETDSSSFTALLELPPPQAVELLIKEDFPAKPMPPPFFPSNIALIDRASKFSIYASRDNSPDSTAILPASSSMKLDLVKQEPLESDSHPNSSPAVSNQSPKSGKRKEREKKVKESNKKSKKVAANEASELSGQREKINARMKLLQELVPGCNKIVLYMCKKVVKDIDNIMGRCQLFNWGREKKLMAFAPRKSGGPLLKCPSRNSCTASSLFGLFHWLLSVLTKLVWHVGTAMVLDEIINHVQALQRQVEFLSMRLAAVNPRIDFNLDAVFAAESGSSIDNSYLGMFDPSIWPEGQINGSRQNLYQQPLHFDGLHQPSWGREDDTSNFISPEDSLLSYDSPPNSASLQSSKLKMEL